VAKAPVSSSAPVAPTRIFFICIAFSPQYTARSVPLARAESYYNRRVRSETVFPNFLGTKRFFP
jgi:hypothetical protein